jgi:hypothetical protein
MFVFIVIILSAVGWSPFPVKDSIFSFIQIQNPYTISILIAVINFILVGFLYLIRKKQKLFTYSSWAVIISLLLITMVDVERFSSIHSVANFKQLTETEETTALKKLIGDNPYRILPIYNQIYGGNYYDSGLVDNWSMTNNIRNLKGFAEFENPRLNELFGQVESRDPNEQNTQNLLSEKKDILSMLSVKYVLLPINEETPKATPFLPEADVINITEPITDPGNGSLFVDSIPIDYSPEQYYSIKFDVDISKNVPQLFYVDFYGGPEFDRNEQQKNVIIETGSHTYKVLIYSGDKNFQYGEVYLRIVSITNNPMKINNIKVTRLASETDNQNYGLIGQTSRYKILENKQAQKLLYIPEQVKNIIDDNDILKNPTNYPQMDKIDYIKGSNDFTTGGKLEIIDIKNNSLSARVISTNKTFVNHAQSYFPGWKAYIDGKSTPIYLVNGVIQGIEVPPGEHTIRFVYDPLSLKIGALLTFAGILFGLVFIILERKHKVNK